MEAFGSTITDHTSQGFIVLDLLLLYPVTYSDDLAHHRLGIFLESSHLVHLLLLLLRVRLSSLAVLLDFFHRISDALASLIKQRVAFCPHAPGVPYGSNHVRLLV